MPRIVATDGGRGNRRAGERVRVATGLREAGFDAPLTLIGLEPHPDYGGPALSEETMLSEDESAAKAIAAKDERYEPEIRHVIRNTAPAIDRIGGSAHLAGSEGLPYANLLVATGAAPPHFPAALPEKRTASSC